MINWLKKITLLLLAFAAVEVTGQSLQLISPAGGETWPGASEQTISWNFLNVDNIQIQYSLDSGLTWVTLVNSLPSSAFTYTWKVPSISTTTARVRITSILNFTQSTSGIFTIPDPTIQLDYPILGTQLDAASGQYVAWNAKGIDTVGIDYSLDNGATWSFLSYAQGYDGYANWVIPDTLTNQARLRVYNIGDTVTADTSGAYSITSPTLKDTAKYFGGNYDGYSLSNNLPNSLTILKANGGERLIPATIDTISWTSNNIDRINIEYSINNGRTWLLLDSNISTQQLFYTWQVPNTPSDSCLLKLTSAAPNIQTISDSLWQIVPSSIQVLFPNGNEQLEATSGQYIQWIANGVNTVAFEYSADNGANWNLIDTAAGSHGFANWIIPNALSPNYLIRVSDNTDSSVVDVSDQSFEVVHLITSDSVKYHGGAFDGYAQANNDTSRITVISPNGNEMWFSATTETIVWDFNNATNVTIEVTYDDGLSWDTLAENIPASQLEYDWYIPSTPSSLCRIRISDVAVGLTDVSDDPFTIPSPNIAISYPNGGEVFEAGSGQYIQWQNADVDSIKLEYSADNGANWSVIGVAPGIDKYANWVVPRVASNQLKIRATDITNPLYTDTSNFSFSSVMPNQLTANKYHGGVFDGYSYYRYFDDYVQIIAANGGEIWGNGTLQTVEWATLNTFENINLEITTDNGITWDTLLRNVPNNPETWNWLINEPISSTCKLRISTVSGTLIDQSDDFFTIANTNGITTASISNSSYCSTDTLQVNFGLSATFLPGNTFTVQLSDSAGSFNGQVVNIGQVTSTSAQTITATLPETYDFSDDYRVRVIASNPPTIGSDNGLDFAINPLPTVQLGNDTIICNGDSVQLTAAAQNASSFLWSTGDTTSSIMITQPGTYSVVASNACGDNFDTIQVNSLIAPTLSLGNDTLVCVNTPVTFNAGASTDQFLWSTGSTDSTITTAIPGMYTATLSNACFSTSDTVILSNKPQLTVNLGNNQGLCNGQNTVLDATNTGANYLWSTGATTSSINVSSAGSYWVQVSNECQTVSDQVVIIDGNISLNLADTVQMCNGSTKTITASGANYYAWSNGSTTNSITVSPTVSTTYAVTATNVYGCSSTADVYVDVSNQIISYSNIVSLTSYTWPINGVTYTATGVYSDTIIGSAGCDSIEVLNLTINSPFSGTDIQTACDSFTWINGITYTVSTNTPTDTLTNSLGSDSVVTLNLTINNSTTATDIQTACDTYTWIDGITYTASTSSPTFTLTNAAGCDSVVTLDLTINNSTTATDIQTACDTYTWIDGVTYTASTSSPTFTLTNAAGCDSVVTLNLTINNSNTGTDIQAACDTYTWIDGITYTASTSTPTFTLTNVAGCDSVVTLDLTINNSTTATDIQTACDTYTWIDGITYTASTSSPTFTLTNAAGCDSVVTLNLTINNSTTATDIQNACDTYTWIDGVTYSASTSSPTFTLTNAAGCDSVVTLNLTINNSTTGTDIQNACDTYTWIDGVTYSASTSSPTFTLTNVAGCDSIVTLNLTINNSTTATDIQAACDTYTWIDGVTYSASTSSPTFTLTNAAGCDSVVTLNLTINNPTASSSSDTACNSYTWLQNNITYTSSGRYYDTIVNALGCDSIVKLFLVIDTLNLSLSSINDSLVSNDATAASYQWINCDSNNAIISGATNQGYQPTMSGNYAVILTKGACTDTSACENVIISNTVENNLNANFSLYPNPTMGTVYLELSNNPERGSLIQIYTLTGQLVKEVQIQNKKTPIDISQLERGIYFFKYGNTTKKIVLTN